jgi:hypothetical protein
MNRQFFYSHRCLFRLCQSDTIVRKKEIRGFDTFISKNSFFWMKCM